jgi:hypothetical protein
MGTYAAHTMLGIADELASGFNFELFTHVTRFLGVKVGYGRRVGSVAMQLHMPLNYVIDGECRLYCWVCTMGKGWSMSWRRISSCTVRSRRRLTDAGPVSDVFYYFADACR